MKRWQVWLGIVISVVFLALALRGLDFTEIWSAIQSVNIAWILPAIPVYFVGIWLRAVRWKILLNPIQTVKLRKLFSIITIGYMGNNIYPARLGELIRAAILKKNEEITISTSLATIIIERIFDGVIMIGFVLLNISSIANGIQENGIAETINVVATWGTGIFMVAFSVFLLSAFFPETFSGILIWLSKKVLPNKLQQTAIGIIEQFFSGLRSLASPLSTIYALTLTLAVWLIETVFYWMVLQAFPIQLSFGTLMFLNGFLNLFTIIPSSPGYIGTFDAPGIALLAALGVNKQLAAGYTVLLHATLWLPVTLVGAIMFAREGLSWNEAIHQSKDGKKI